MESSKPRFATILAARGNDGRPSDLEFMLRSHCQKLRVVEKLSGAHLLIPSESSLAIRAYFSCDLEDLARRQTEVANNEDENDDFDGLKAFMSSFKLVVVLFIIPGFEKQREQLDDDSSFFHRAQRLVRSLTSVTAKEQGNTDKTARVSLVPDSNSAVSTLVSISNAMKKKELKEAYFERQREEVFLPQESTNIVPSTSAAAAAKYVARTFRQWAERFELPPGEADVLMSMLGSLGEITVADSNVLDSLPIDSRSKMLLQSFFGSQRKTTKLPPKPQCVRNMSANAGAFSYYHQHHQHHFVPSENSQTHTESQLPVAAASMRPSHFAGLQSESYNNELLQHQSYLNTGAPPPRYHQIHQGGTYLPPQGAYLAPPTLAVADPTCYRQYAFEERYGAWATANPRMP